MKENTADAQDTTAMFFNQTDWAWGIEQLIPILTAVLAVWLAYFGFKQALKKIAKDHQHQFQIRTYEQMLPYIKDVQEYGSSYVAYISGLVSQVNSNYSAQKENRSPVDLGYRPKDYIEKFTAYIKSINQLSRNLQNILIIEPRLEIFVTALNYIHSTINDLADQIPECTHPYCYREIEVLAGNTVKAPPDEISLEEAERIQKVVRGIISTMLEGSNYLEDLKIELQNILLSEVYSDRKLDHREPSDPDKLVIDLKNYDFLKNYFEEKDPLDQRRRKLANIIERQLRNAA